MIGLGTQDSLEEAREFVEDRGTTFTMLWDELFQSWIELGVTSQPTAVLFTPDGTIITGGSAGSPRIRSSNSPPSTTPADDYIAGLAPGVIRGRLGRWW